MKTSFKRWMVSLSMLLISAAFVGTAAAQCPSPALPKAKLHPQAWRVGDDTASLLRVGEFTDPIVGMWRVQLTSGGAIIDQTLQQWHSDGTEIMNSSRNPATQSFCLGVWEGTGDGVYRLNHYGISWDPTTSTTEPLGLANILESVTLSADGNSFTGVFTITQYDESGNTLASFSGSLVGYRVKVSTRLKVLF